MSLNIQLTLHASFITLLIVFFKVDRWWMRLDQSVSWAHTICLNFCFKIVDVNKILKFQNISDKLLLPGLFQRNTTKPNSS